MHRAVNIVLPVTADPSLPDGPAERGFLAVVGLCTHMHVPKLPAEAFTMFLLLVDQHAIEHRATLHSLGVHQAAAAYLVCGARCCCMQHCSACIEYMSLRIGYCQFGGAHVGDT